MREPALPCPPHAFDEPAARAHRRRPLPVVPHHVRLDVQIHLGDGRVEGTVHQTFAAIGDGVDRVTFDAADLEVHDARRGEAHQAVHAHAAGVDVHLDPPLQAGEAVTLALRFTARPTAGLYFVDGPHGRQAWTQGAMEDHHHWFPCFDAPEHMVTTEVRAEVPEAYVALSNGAPCAPPTPTQTGWHRFHWRHDVPHALYLLTLVVDRVVEVADRHGDVTLHHWVPAGRQADARAIFARMGPMLDFFGQATGRPYPYPRYGHAFLHDFMWGGMENTTLTSLTDRVLVPAADVDEADVERLVAHELAHQWFGDLIAPRGWPEIWLNESFATYFEVLCMGALEGPDGFARRLVVNRDNYLAEARDRYARPVVTRTYAHPYVLFDRHAYEKGSLVLHTLRDQLGHAAFWRGVRAYVRRCAGTAAETPELRRCFEEASGADLSAFFEQFVYGEGHPAVTIAWQHDRRTGLEITLTRTDSGPQQLTVDLAWGGPLGARRRRIRLGTGACTVLVDTDGLPPRWVALDPDQACLLEIDESAEPEATLRARLDAATVPRLLRMRTARALGERGAPANTRALIDALTDDPSDAVRGEAARALGQHQSDAARQALLACVDGDAPWRVRAAAARAVGVGADRGAVEALGQRLSAETRSHRVRAGLIGALGAIPDEASRALIRPALTDPALEGAIAAAAVSALAAQETPEVADELLLRSQAGHPVPVRGAAIVGLATLAKHDAIDAALTKRLREALEALLFDPSLRARYAATRAVKQLGDAASAPALRRAHGAEGSALVRRALREALGAVTD